MRVFLHGSEGRPPPAVHVMYVAPAAWNPSQQDIQHDWVDHENKPQTFTIEFRHGTADVEDSLGKYLTDPAVGMAKKSRLVIPTDFSGTEFG